MKRFWDKVHKLPGVDSCWIWTASKNRDGYGQFKLDDKVRGAHRVSWKLVKGEWPAYLCHTCDNPACVNPDHLYEGNSQTNADDKMSRGRHRDGRKYNDHLIRRIRREYAVRFSSGALSTKYKIPKRTILCILNGRIRRSAGGPIRDRGVRYWSNRFGSGKTGRST